VPPHEKSIRPIDARHAAELASELKALNVVVLDLRGVTDSLIDFVIASGTSDTHVRQRSRDHAGRLKAAGGLRIRRRGSRRPVGRFDYLTTVSRVSTRRHVSLYQLERLWGDATPVKPEAGHRRGGEPPTAGRSARLVRAFGWRERFAAPLRAIRVLWPGIRVQYDHPCWRVIGDGALPGALLLGGRGRARCRAYVPNGRGRASVAPDGPPVPLEKSRCRCTGR
jgi:ribosome-associated protein